MEDRLRGLRAASTADQVEQERIDVTLPGWPAPQGRLHPVTQTIREITEVFASMGFGVEEGPEVEWDRYNFDMLNIPKDHPARDMWDTLWVDYVDDEGARPMLLRTHTSPMQARIMETAQPPVRVIVPGKAFRYEATDATHEWHFHQVEGLAVDEGITFADLKGTLFEFAKRIFGEERRARFRCDFFPFVEPGVDMAIDCFRCDGSGCRICSGTGWIEILGAGDGASVGARGSRVRLPEVHRVRLRDGRGAHLHAAPRHHRHTTFLRQRRQVPAPILKKAPGRIGPQVL